MAELQLDEARVKASLIAMWRGGSGDTLVKVMPFGMMPNPARPIGYCTTIKFINGRTPSEIERAVGFADGTKLLSGAEIFLVRPLPMPAQFMYRGHSNTPAGVPTIDGQVLDPAYPPGLGVPQWEVFGQMQTALTHLASVPAGQKFLCPFATLPRPL